MVKSAATADLRPAAFGHQGSSPCTRITQTRKDDSVREQLTAMYDKMLRTAAQIEQANEAASTNLMEVALLISPYVTLVDHVVSALAAFPPLPRFYALTPRSFGWRMRRYWHKQFGDTSFRYSNFTVPQGEQFVLFGADGTTLSTQPMYWGDVRQLRPTDLLPIGASPWPLECYLHCKGLLKSLHRWHSEVDAHCSGAVVKPVGPPNIDIRLR